MKTQISRELLKSLRPQINAALVKIAKDNGLKSLTAENGSFSANNFTFKLLGLAEGGATPEAEAYKQYQKMYRKLPILGDKFSFARQTFQIVGLRRTKVIATQSGNGKTYLISLDQLHSHFNS